MRLRQRQPRVHDNGHLDFIRGLPCCICLNNIETEAAHVKMADPRAAKRNVGIGEKADDRWTLPLCGKHHRLQHEIGEEAFWQGSHINPIFLCLALHSISGDHEAGESIVQAYH